MEESKLLVDAKELAAILKVPVSWIYGCSKGKIPCIKVGKYLRFDPQEVIEYLKTKNINKGA